MRLALSIALRFLVSSRGQSVLIALGIAVGIAVQVFIGSLIGGLQASLIDTTIGRAPHITVASVGEDRLITDYQITVDRLKTNGDLTAVIATVTQPAFTVVDGRFETVVVRGLPLPEADGIYQISEGIVEGRVQSGQVLVGRELAADLDLAVGDGLLLLTGAGQRTQVTISGIFDLQVASLNRSWVITDPATVQGWFGLDDRISSIEMQVKDVFAAASLAAGIAAEMADPDLKVSQWKEDNEQLLVGLQGQSTSSLMIQVFVVIAVSLGIASVLAVTVIQKSRQIGILKAMGIRDRDASWVFLFQGLILGLIGGIVGIALGLGLTLVFSVFVVNPDGTPLVALLIDIPFVIGSGFVAVAAGMLAALAPARRSRKLEPMEVIRGG